MDLNREQQRMKERHSSMKKNRPRRNNRGSLFVEKNVIDDDVQELATRTGLVCPFCKTHPTTASTRTGKLYPCLKCSVRRVYLSRYKLTLTDFSRMLAEQNNCCAICGVEFDYEGRNTTPAVDHCHDVGHIRGLLCGRCNTGLGFFLDDTTALKNAINYLDNNKLYRCWSVNGVVI